MESLLESETPPWTPGLRCPDFAFLRSLRTHFYSS
jgi:hypothetical protein